MGQPADVVEAAGPYLWWVAPSIIPLFFGLAEKQFCEALDRPWIPTFIMLGGVVLNIALNALLIQGRLGFPAMGLQGAGVATLISRCLVALVLWGWMMKALPWPSGCAERRGENPETHLHGIASTGHSGGLSALLEMGVFALGAFMMGWIHADALAAHQIAFTCASTTFMFSLSLGMAASIRVGQALGAGEVHRVRRIGFLAMGHTVLIMSAFAIVLWMQGPTLAGWFVDSVKVTTLAVQLLTVAAAFQVFDGLQVVAICILRGMQDVRIPATLAILAYWLVTAPLGYVLAFVAGMGAMGIWIGFARLQWPPWLIGRFHLLAVRDASQ